MSESTIVPEDENQEVPVGPKPGVTSKWLSEQGLNHQILEPDHIGIECLGIKPIDLIKVVSALKDDGFDYLQCQGGYDEGAGQNLVCF